MAQFRRVLAPLSAIWLFCQIGTAALVPVALRLSAGDPHATDCACGHGPGATCPMHHNPVGRSAPCAMQAANTAGTAVLTTFAQTAGLITEPTRSIGPSITTAYPRAADVLVIGERPFPPDPPPPRV